MCIWFQINAQNTFSSRVHNGDFVKRWHDNSRPGNNRLNANEEWNASYIFAFIRFRRCYCICIILFQFWTSSSKPSSQTSVQISFVVWIRFSIAKWYTRKPTLETFGGINTFVICKMRFHWFFNCIKVYFDSKVFSSQHNATSAKALFAITMQLNRAFSIFEYNLIAFVNTYNYYDWNSIVFSLIISKSF